ncbi:Protein CBG26381 [Caenorhabditis briggsae]|uniref:Protein CBG26381 n=1 Tax=Caenorhabditis briggsae TaxID=6238 RepID=B6IG47_CAEBR|nr:Protein CBG26381 [Caenorhabditis briggsae]CAR98877.1 Protein CBG26381 [Caenorhabditis briggsae]
MGKVVMPDSKGSRFPSMSTLVQFAPSKAECPIHKKNYLILLSQDILGDDWVKMTAKIVDRFGRVWLSLSMKSDFFQYLVSCSLFRLHSFECFFFVPYSLSLLLNLKLCSVVFLPPSGFFHLIPSPIFLCPDFQNVLFRSTLVDSLETGNFEKLYLS